MWLYMSGDGQSHQGTCTVDIWGLWGSVGLWVWFPLYRMGPLLDHQEDCLDRVGLCSVSVRNVSVSSCQWMPGSLMIDPYHMVKLVFSYRFNVHCKGIDGSTSPMTLVYLHFENALRFKHVELCGINPPPLRHYFVLKFSRSTVWLSGFSCVQHFPYFLL